MRSNVFNTSGFSSVTVSTKADAMNELNFLSFKERRGALEKQKIAEVEPLQKCLSFSGLLQLMNNSSSYNKGNHNRVGGLDSWS